MALDLQQVEEGKGVQQHDLVVELDVPVDVLASHVEDLADDDSPWRRSLSELATKERRSLTANGGQVFTCETCDDGDSFIYSDTAFTAKIIDEILRRNSSNAG